MTSGEIDVSASHATGVWLTDGDGTEALHVILHQYNEQDAARAYVEHCMVHGHNKPSTVRLFPLLDVKHVPKNNETRERMRAAFSDAWVEVHL